MKCYAMTWGSLTAGLLAINSGIALAAEPALVVSVWPGKPSGETREPGAEVTQPARPGENPPTTRITNIDSPSLSVYRPPKEQRNGTSVVICPGGAFRILAWDKEGTEVAEWFNSLGVSAFVLKYRTPTSDRPSPWLAPAQDAQRAIRVVRHRAREWGLAPDRVGMLGFSAGGSAAANAALQSNVKLYEAVDEMDQNSCRPDFVALVYPAYLIDEKGMLKPELTVTRETPPMFLAHAFNDGVSCENSVQLFLALKKAGVPADLHVYSSGGHGFGLRPSDQPSSTWPQRCEDWLRLRGLLKMP